MDQKYICIFLSKICKRQLPGKVMFEGKNISNSAKLTCGPLVNCNAEYAMSKYVYQHLC